MAPRDTVHRRAVVSAVAIALGAVVVASGSASAAIPASPTKLHDCTKLISLVQLRKATGLADAAYVPGKSRGLPKGETYCQYLARKGATSIALSVWTGPSRAQFDVLWDAGASAQKVPGIGDAARVSVRDGTGGARVGGTGIGVVIKETGTAGLRGVNVRSAITNVLRIVAKRL